MLCGSYILLADTEGKQNEQVKQLLVKVLRERYNFRAVRREATGHLGEEHLGRGAGAKALGQE